jgi:hypothetical protein
LSLTKTSIKNTFKDSQFQRDLFILIVLIPAALLLLFLLPASEKDSLILYHNNPNIISAYTTNFVHKGFDHFWGNAVSYVVLIIPIYLLNLSAGKTRKFYLMMLSSFILLPFLLSFVALLVPTNSTLGFSGIVAAFLGFLPYSILSYLKKSNNWKIGISGILNSVLIFSFGIIIFNLPAALSNLYGLLLLAVVGGLFFSSFVMLARDGSLKVCLSSSKRLFKKNKLVGFILLFLSLFYLVSVPDLFQIIRTENTITGIHVHYAGFIFGFFVSYIFVRNEFKRKRK